MMHRAEITHCAPIIENIYGANYPYYCRAAERIFIEVMTAREWITIENIEYHQKETYSCVQELQKAIEERDHD